MQTNKSPSLPQQTVKEDTECEGGFSINIRTPALVKNSITFSPQAQEPIPILESKQSSKKITHKQICQPLTSPTSRIKLRDYLFLAQTSSTKHATHKRKHPQNSNGQESLSKDQSSLTFRAMAHGPKKEVRKNKYEIDNTQLLTILKEDLSCLLEESIKQLDFIRELFNVPRDRAEPTNSEMILMFELRSMAKEKLKRLSGEMKAMVERQRKRKQTTDYDSLIEEGEFGRNLKVIKEMFSQKYLEEIQNQIPQ